MQKEQEIVIKYLFESQKKEKNYYIKSCIKKYINKKINSLFQIYCDKIKLCNLIIKNKTKNINADNWEEIELENIEIRNKIFEYENELFNLSLYYEKNY